MKRKRFQIGIFTMMLFLMSLTGTSVSYAEENPKELEDMIEETALSIIDANSTFGTDLLENEEVFPAGSSLSDWTAMTLAFSGEKAAYPKYLENLEEYVTEKYQMDGYLDSFNATEYHRVALTVLALGGDPTEFGTDENGNSINLVADGTYDFHGESLGQQGSNGIIYALITLDSRDYQIPESANLTREQLLEEISSMQDGDGGIGLTSESSGSQDITAMALQALAKYTENPEINEAIDRALTWLATQITGNGTLITYGEESAESTAQMIMALCALGIDPAEDERFMTNGVSLLDGLKQFRQPNGSYVHTQADEIDDLMATQQSLLALEAVQQLRQEGTWILDYTHYEFDAETNTNLSVWLIGGIIILLIVVIIIIVLRNRSNQERDRRYV